MMRLKGQRNQRSWYFDPSNTGWRLCSPEQEAIVDKAEMLSYFQDSKDIKPDAVTHCRGYVAKLWGATSPEPWVTIQSCTPGICFFDRLRDSDEPISARDSELEVIYKIIHGRFRDERNRLLEYRPD